MDTEDDGAGHPLLWCLRHDEGWNTCRTQGEFLNTLEQLGTRKAQVWATNLEYDLVNVFGPERIAEVQLRFGRSSLCGARWKGVDFRDTMRHVPMSVAELGEHVGVAKREAGLFAGGRVTAAALRRRCLGDATITYRTAERFREVYRELGSEPKLTLASTALNLWRERFWQQGMRRPSLSVWEAAREAYHGGRTQAFYVGEFRDCHMIDVASMFPWAMTCAPLPLPWGAHRAVRRGSEPKPWGLYRVRADCALRHPLLPVRTAEGTVYPQGSWEGWYVGEEVIACLKAGGRVRVLGGIEFSERCSPFTGYVEKLFERKSTSRGLNRLTYKILLNSLYGKFGQQGKRIFAVPFSRFRSLEDPPVEWRPWCGLAIYSKDGTPPPWSNMVWPAWVTARARVRLAEELKRLRSQGAQVLYVDTDSILYRGPGRYPAKARAAGEFEMRGDYRRALLVGKKEYALETDPNTWEVHVKGVPEAERMEYLKTGHARFKRPTRMREAARNGEQANVWTWREKERRRDLKKQADADGLIATPVIET